MLITRFGILFFVLSTLFVFSPTLSFGEDKSRPLQVGFIGPFSGAAQIYGEAARNGFEMALDELGRDWITVHYEDDQFLPKKTVAAFQKLVHISNVDLIITIGSTPSKAVAPIAEREKIPLIAWASDRSVSKERSFIVRSYPSGYEEGAVTVQEAKERNLGKFAVLISTNDYSQSWRSGFVDNVPEGELLLDEELPADSQEFRSVLLKARTKGVEQLVFCLNPTSLGIAAKQARELGITAGIFGCEYLHDSNVVRVAQGALHEAWFATISVRKPFRKKYRDKFHTDSIISGAANHYDLAHLLHAVAGQGEISREEIIAKMIALKEQRGAVGLFAVVQNEHDRYFDISLVIQKVSNTVG